MRFASPVWLLGLLALPLLVLLRHALRSRASRYDVRFTAVSSLRAAAAAAPKWPLYVPLAVVLAGLGVAFVALARPEHNVEAAGKQAAVVLVLDHSGSMDATDVQPSRLAAADQAAQIFTDQLSSSVALGAVTFSSAPDNVVAPTTDHSQALAAINSVQAEGSTDTGDALALALQVLTQSAPHSKGAIVLLSDGAANAGQSSVAIAQQAARKGIPVYTVALGTPNGTLNVQTALGNVVQVPVPPDPQLMQQIATASKGREFTAEDETRLTSVYRHLGASLHTRTVRHEMTAAFAAGALVLLVAGGVLSLRGAGRLP
jgi:Ca-activated chloride channel homolog